MKEQSTLFFDDSDKIESAIKTLKDNGYIVIKEVPINEFSIKNSSNLVELFYSLLSFYNPGRSVHYSENTNVDKKTASNFVKSRMEVGCSKKRALQECANIIKCILENEDKLGLSFKITSISILGQDTLKWITDRAITILNEEDYRYGEEELKRLDRELNTRFELEALDDLPNQIENMKRFLEETNG
jgi:hypothetical protein